MNISVICLIRKHGVRRTPYILILLNFSIQQVTILGATLVYLISRMHGMMKESLQMVSTRSVLPSACFPVNCAILVLALDRVLYIKNSPMYKTISMRSVTGAFIAGWALWVVTFVLLVLLRSYEFIHVVSDIVFPIEDCSLLLFLICIEFHTWCITREQHRPTNARLASTVIIFSYMVFRLFPSVSIFIVERFFKDLRLGITYPAGIFSITIFFVIEPCACILLERRMKRLFRQQISSCCRRRDMSHRGTNAIEFPMREVQVTSL